MNVDEQIQGEVSPKDVYLTGIVQATYSFQRDVAPTVHSVRIAHTMGESRPKICFFKVGPQIFIPPVALTKGDNVSFVAVRSKHIGYNGQLVALVNKSTNTEYGTHTTKFDNVIASWNDIK